MIRVGVLIAALALAGPALASSGMVVLGVDGVDPEMLRATLARLINQPRPTPS